MTRLLELASTLLVAFLPWRATVSGAGRGLRLDACHPHLSGEVSL